MHLSRFTQCPLHIPSITVAPLVAMTLAATASAQQAKPLADQLAGPRTSSASAPEKAQLVAPNLGDLESLFHTSQVHVQAADDGSIFAVGGNYKAQFTGAGVTFATRSGDRTVFSLQSATVGGKPLTLNADAQPSNHGDRVTIDRGAFIEQYLLKADAIEQTFTINQLPPNGDLVLKIAAGMPSMIITEKSGAFELAGPNARVNYTKAVLVDGLGTRTALATGITNGTIEIRVPSATLNRAAFPITIDPVISTSEAMGGPPSYRHADVAYDASNNRFLVVAEFEASANDGDIYSVLVNPSGTVVPNTLHFVDVTFDNWRKPKAANNNIANRFMVVAERGDAPSRGVWGATVSSATGDTSAQFQIINGGGGEKTNPVVGGDSFVAGPTYFLVMWEWAASATDHDIAGRLIDVNGVQSGGEIFLDLTNTNQSNPAISKSNLGGQWMVVWQNSFSATDEDIFGAKVNWDGQISYAANVLDFTSVSSKQPAVSSPLPTGQYLVVYESNGAIATRLVDSTMTTQQITTLESLGDNPFAQNRWEPTVDADGDKFVVGYSEAYQGSSTDWDLYADTLCGDGNQLHLAEIHRNLDFSSGRDQQAAVATTWSGGGQAMGPALLAWTHQVTLPSAFGTIYDGRYNAHTSCCPSDCFPSGGDGLINIDDLVAVITHWTAPGQPCMNCDSDVNGDFNVNIDDLVKVITGWGVCP